MRNILVVNVNWLGDVIFSSPIFPALRKKYPQAKIACMAVPRVKEILECIPEIDEIIVYDEEGAHRSLFAKIKLVFQLWKKKFDITFLLHRSLTRALIVFLAGIPQRIGYDEKGRGFLLTHKVKNLGSHVHRSDHYLNVIESYAIDVEDRRTVLSVTKGAEIEIEGILISKGIQLDDPYIVVHPGANWNLKRWPAENFSLLIDQLINKKKIKVVLSGSKRDIDLAKGISFSVKENVVVLAGETTLKQSIALFKRAILFVSSDSGPLHMASSVGTTTIGIFGPTRPQITGPRGIGKSVILERDTGCNHQPCYFLECRDNVCMQAVTVNQVINAVDGLLAKTKNA